VTILVRDALQPFDGPRRGAGQPLVLTDFPDEWAQFAIAMRSAGLPPGP
jgi:hypothetical protein